MKWTSLFRAQLRQSIRTPWAFFFVLAAIIIASAVAWQSGASQPDRFLVGVVNEDEGEYGRRLIADLAGHTLIELKELPREKALTMLRQDQLEGVFIIRKNYTAKLEACDFARIVEWYTSPSSRAAATVGEPLINTTMRIWLEEMTIRSTRDYLEESGIAYTAADEDAQRAMISQIWQAETAVLIEAVMLDETAAQNDGQQLETKLSIGIRWYALLIVFYLIVSATWVLDINKRGLRIRAIQSGGHLWQILLGTSLAPLLLGLAGYWITGSLCCIMSGGGWLTMLALSFPMVIYLWTVLGMTLALVSFLRQPLALMFLAPLLTFTNALLSGLIAALPDWAGMLVILSGALPGRWLMLSISRPSAFLPALICCAIWFSLGVGISEIKSRN